MNAGSLRYSSLDVWRGVACLMVVCFHSVFYITENPHYPISDTVYGNIFRVLNCGWIGVPVFFVISGYCIAAACESLGVTARSVGAYFFRRFKRIYPPYWCVLLIVLAPLCVKAVHQFFCNDIILFIDPWSLSISNWIGTATLTESWREHLMGDKSRLFLTPAWSLCYEEQFYAVCGVLLLSGRQWFYPMLGMITAIIAIIVIAKHSFSFPKIDGFFFDGRWLLFAAGLLVFYSIHLGNQKFRRSAALALILTTGAAITWWHWGPKLEHENLAKELVVSSGFAFLLMLLHKYDSKMASQRWLKPFAFCGAMCYSLYLLHWPVVKGLSELFYRAGIQSEQGTLFITLPAALGFSVLLAWLFHLLVERRLMNTFRSPSAAKMSQATRARIAEPRLAVAPLVGSRSKSDTLE
jgi:peptidoglycan/LPS O-acetylase OafA/YrhL